MEEVEGITVYRYPVTFAEDGVLDYLNEYFRSFVYIAKLSWRVWRKHHFDVIHICNPPEIFFPIGLVFRLLGAKFIFDHHDLFPEMVRWRFAGFKGSAFDSFSRVMEYMTYKSANVVIATNESYKGIGVRRNRVNSQRVWVVRNGPKCHKFLPEKPNPAIRRGFPFVACYVGVMGEEDGVSDLVEVIRHIVHSKRRMDILFILVGDGSDRAAIERNVNEYGLRDFIQMPGLIQEDRLLCTYMSSADVLLSPEPWTPLNACSTFIKVGEYMAMGRPIVAYDLKETRVTAGAAAVYVQPGNVIGYAEAIIDLLDDNVRRERMGNLGRDRIRRFLAWEHQEIKLLQAYKSAVG